MSWVQQLQELGFERAGEWGCAAGSLRCSLNSHRDASGLLYAFVASDRVLYIGKTTTSLYRRMYGYQNPGPTQSTNIACNAKLRAMLDAGERVEILVLLDRGQLQFGGFRVNLAAGLEDTLIDSVKPAWNTLGK